MPVSRREPICTRQGLCLHACGAVCSRCVCTRWNHGEVHASACCQRRLAFCDRVCNDAGTIGTCCLPPDLAASRDDSEMPRRVRRRTRWTLRHRCARQRSCWKPRASVWSFRLLCCGCFASIVPNNKPVSPWPQMHSAACWMLSCVSILGATCFLLPSHHLHDPSHQQHQPRLHQRSDRHQHQRCTPWQQHGQPAGHGREQRRCMSRTSPSVVHWKTAGHSEFSSGELAD